MSLFTDDSPMSDLKMDISGSCSSDSPAATSPEAVLGKGEPLSYPCKYPDELRILKSSSDLENLNEEDSESIKTTVNHSLDNRRANSQSSQLISVHSHPLMSPDSSPVFPEDELKVVAPQSPLRLAKTQPVSNRSSPKRHDRPDMLDKDNGSAVSISSDSEADLSQYQANVGPSFQCVSLVSKQNTSVGKRDPGRSNSCSNIDVEALPASAHPRQSSIESLSVRSFDELDGISNFLSRCSSTSLIEEVHLASSAGEPTANGRNSHKVVLSDGTTREIDMKVIEPYKRVLSHGGYLKDDCQNAIVVFSSCFLPDRSRADYRYVMDSLFLYVLVTLEQLVTEDYVLLYLHGGSCKGNVPSFPWLKRCYLMLDRRLRKSLKNVYMVHPTFWLKSLVWMSRPFISSKFWRKLVYVKNLEELYSLLPSVETQAVPEKVKSYDVAHFKK